VHPIADLQIEYSLISRGVEDSILPACRALGVGITAYGVLSRWLISGHWSREMGAQGDFRASSPRFQSENLDRNLALVDAIKTIADAKGVTVEALDLYRAEHAAGHDVEEDLEAVEMILRRFELADRHTTRPLKH
jgi:aryl-alcohol dehydrogenase-like predicted oxidoreductase